MNNAEMNGIGVTDIKVYKITGGSLKANVAVTFNDLLVVYFKLIEGKNGIFISWPNHSYTEGRKTKYRDDVYSLNKDFVDDLTDLIIEVYEINRTEKVLDALRSNPECFFIGE